MLQDYNTSSNRLFFIRPRFSRHRSPFSPRSNSSLLSLPGPSLYIVCLVRPVARLRGSSERPKTMQLQSRISRRVRNRAGASSFAAPGKEPVLVQWLLLSSRLADPR
ncbi:hypothetical protein TNCV_2632471 [Trichonephila clavipes]|nr:hypothetical protein TNCV_2632471 [Trichonephila clavipes]